MSDPKWRDVPNEKLRDWYRTYEEWHGGMDLDAPCPVCDATTLHVFYIAGRPCELVRDGRAFKAYGSGWQWCSTCRSFIHFSGLVPAEWPDPHLAYDREQLTALPEELERARRFAERE